MLSKYIYTCIAHVDTQSYISYSYIHTNIYTNHVDEEHLCLSAPVIEDIEQVLILWIICIQIQ